MMARELPLASWEGEVEGGEVEEEVAAGVWRRERMAERIGSVSSESGERPSGRLSRLGVVDCEGEVVIVSLLILCRRESCLLSRQDADGFHDG